MSLNRYEATITCITCKSNTRTIRPETSKLVFQVLFNNVTLVGMQGFNNFRALRRVREAFTVQKNLLDTRRMDMISLRTYVNVMQGKVSKIDRKEQCLILNDNSFLSYDLLFLMTGEQFRKPLKTSEANENPENVFIINNALDANRAIAKLKELMMYNRDPDCKSS